MRHMGEKKHIIKKSADYFLDGNRSKFRLETSIALRTPEFDKRVKKNRKKSKLAKAARKRNR